jgi:hypothetical protein
MTTGRLGLVVAAVTVGLSAGCVDRRFVVETNVPGAQIAVDGTPIGPSPADSRWEYAGSYQFIASAPGYQPLAKRVHFKAKWYQYPPFDLIAEAFWPFRIEDVRRVYLELEPLQPVNQAELIAAADQLRARGQTLPPSTVADEGDRPRGTQPAVTQPPPPTATVPTTQLPGSLPPSVLRPDQPGTQGPGRDR